MELFYRQLGQGQPFIILHGLFGSSDNWLTQAKLLSEHYHVFLIDQRNHGLSPHHDQLNYDVLADDLHAFIVQHHLTNPIILGHSMGGKAAMKFALRHPELLQTLIVVDMAIRKYPVHHNDIVEGLKTIPVDSLKSRNEADEILSKHVPEPDVRQFLLKNLHRKPEGGFKWKINLPAIEKSLPNVGEETPTEKTFEKDALFIRGKKSNYVSDRDFDAIKVLFPKAEFITMETGHWVQAEKPQEFVEVILDYLKKIPLKN